MFSGLVKTRYYDPQFLSRPNVECCESEFPSLINIGSCGLHVVHGAFKTGFQSVGWDLNKVFKAMWKFFHDSPARRDRNFMTPIA